MTMYLSQTHKPPLDGNVLTCWIDLFPSMFVCVIVWFFVSLRFVSSLRVNWDLVSLSQKFIGAAATLLRAWHTSNESSPSRYIHGK